jgi:hypothetical protein
VDYICYDAAAAIQEMQETDSTAYRGEALRAIADIETIVSVRDEGEPHSIIHVPTDDDEV